MGTFCRDPSLQDVHDTETHYSPVLHSFHNHDLGVDTTLSVASSAGDISVTVADATGFSVGDRVFISENGSINSEEVNDSTITAIAGSVITLDGPISNGYTTAADFEKVEKNLSATTGSLASPVIYEAGPSGVSVWHIDRVMISMRCSAAPDDSKFGNLTALTNGMVMRYRRSDRDMILANWKSNDDMIDSMYDVTYSTKAGGGDHGVRGRWTFTRFKTAIRLDAALSDKLQILVQDDITSLVNMHITAQGHFEGKEAR